MKATSKGTQKISKFLIPLSIYFFFELMFVSR